MDDTRQPQVRIFYNRERVNHSPTEHGNVPVCIAFHAIDKNK